VFGGGGRVCGDHVRAVQQCHLDDGDDGDGIDRMAGRKGRAGKTQHGVMHVVAQLGYGAYARPSRRIAVEVNDEVRPQPLKERESAQLA
jgi:hypothetical protein